MNPEEFSSSIKPENTNRCQTEEGEEDIMNSLAISEETLNQQEQINPNRNFSFQNNEITKPDLGFDPANIVQGPPVYIRKQVYYQGYASTTWGIAQATNIIDFIGCKTDSDDCLPFAVKLIENNELISVAEDNGEFACGKVLEKTLKKLDGYNVLVCVARKVKGAFVVDMVQGQKLHAVKEAAEKALELLHKQLTGGDLIKDREKGVNDHGETNSSLKVAHTAAPPPSLEAMKDRMKRKSKR